jgi:hypothetical protein
VTSGISLYVDVMTPADLISRRVGAVVSLLWSAAVWRATSDGLAALLVATVTTFLLGGLGVLWGGALFSLLNWPRGWLGSRCPLPGHGHRGLSACAVGDTGAHSSQAITFPRRGRNRHPRKLTGGRAQAVAGRAVAGRSYLAAACVPRAVGISVADGH